jgi:hypothetical protein
MANESSTATRHNKGKVDYTLIPVDAMQAEARVWMQGEEKYGRHNWEKLWGHDTTKVVMQSLMRHACAILSGETIDDESGEHHAAHIRCNAAMLIRHYNETQGETNSLQLSQNCTTEYGQLWSENDLPVKFDGEFWYEEELPGYVNQDGPEFDKPETHGWLDGYKTKRYKHVSVTLNGAKITTGET